jgi:hypothetical protein
MTRAQDLHRFFTAAPDPVGMAVGRSARIGLIGAAAMAAVYAAVVGGLSGSLGHLADQVRTDWYLLGPIITGFGIQVGLVAELRQRRRHLHTATVAAATGGTGSTVGMVACCAHHIADIAPFIAATGAATFLVGYRMWLMAAGLAVTMAGITLAARRLRHLSLASPTGAPACAAH